MKRLQIPTNKPKISFRDSRVDSNTILTNEPKISFTDSCFDFKILWKTAVKLKIRKLEILILIFTAIFKHQF